MIRHPIFAPRLLVAADVAAVDATFVVVGVVVVVPVAVVVAMIFH